MVELQSIADYLEDFAPSRLAEEWDNVGLLVGDRRQSIRRLMTCLTVTPASVEEAVRERVDLIVAHHPLPFHPLKRLTSDHTAGRLLLHLIRAQVAVYSPHTAFDSAAAGINQQLAAGLGLVHVTPLVPASGDAAGLGAGRQGTLPTRRRLEQVAAGLKTWLGLEGLHMVGRPEREIGRVAVACGAAGTFLESARQAGCELLVTGETNFHTCLEAEARDVALLLPGHFASERFAVVTLADRLREQFPALEIWASRTEHDPLRWV
jgi:dinuclear metal center YbgI/SA1388 family protein